MVNYPVVASVVQLLGSAISSAKTARDIAKDSSDNALKAAISELYDALLDVKDRALQLDEENRALKAELTHKHLYVGPLQPHGYYYEGQDREHPICPSCFQAKTQIIAFMGSLHNWNGGMRRACLLCGKHIYEREMTVFAIG